VGHPAGFFEEYVLPACTYEQNPHVQLLHFITPAFWEALHSRVWQEFEQQIASYGLHAPAESAVHTKKAALSNTVLVTSADREAKHAATRLFEDSTLLAAIIK
jgi:hypothetical protein